MKHLGKISVITLLLGSFLVGCERSTPINTKSVDKLDLERYMGTWYEIGRYDMAFERGLVGSSNVKYLWILLRTPEMDTDILESILRMAANRGYDTSKILWVPQK